jgi:hypothetical protein
VPPPSEAAIIASGVSCSSESSRRNRNGEVVLRDRPQDIQLIGRHVRQRRGRNSAALHRRRRSDDQHRSARAQDHGDISGSRASHVPSMSACRRSCSAFFISHLWQR